MVPVKPKKGYQLDTLFAWGVILTPHVRKAAHDGQIDG